MAKKVSSFNRRISELLDGKFKERVDEFKHIDKITMEKFARVTGAGSRQLISKWISDDYKYPNLESLEKVAQTYDITIDWLCGYDDVPSKEEQDEYEIFKHYGFSSDFHNTLVEISNQKYSQSADYVNTINILFSDISRYYYDDNGVELCLKKLNTLDCLHKYLTRSTLDTSYLVDDDIIDSTIKQLSGNHDLNLNEDIKSIIDHLENCKPVHISFFDAGYLEDIANNLKALRNKLDKKSSPILLK